MKSRFSKKIKFISIICIISFMFQGCAGKRDPILVDKIQKGDSELSCKGIQLKLNSTKDDIKSKEFEETLISGHASTQFSYLSETKVYQSVEILLLFAELSKIIFISPNLVPTDCIEEAARKVLKQS